MQHDARPSSAAHRMVIAEHVQGRDDLETIREVKPLERVHDRLLRFSQIVLESSASAAGARMHAPAA